MPGHDLSYASGVRALLVVNPQATATTPAGRDVLAHALASEVKLDVVETDYRGHAADAAARSVVEGYDLVVAHGGDGTVNEVVNGVLRGGADRPLPMLGVVPGGSANVFAGALGLPRDPVEATYRLLQSVEHGTSRRVGLGRVASAGGSEDHDRWFTFNAGVGWDADVVAGVEEQRAKGRVAGPVLYARTALASYFSQRRHEPALTVQIPGEPVFEDMRLAFVSNTDPWTYLGDKPLRLNPSTSFDGDLGLFALHGLGLPTVLRYLTHLLVTDGNPKGENLLRRDDVAYIRVTSQEPVNLQVDGDLLGTCTEVEFTSAPGVLTVAV
ncbi:diacylglycerol kinase catalytic region [Actinosynnema mirum DSM 43827]|uniref:Diacylglycerol kinase catalytic region n=1 Tax=Actinosynnema mirum (strain ATCC 29888 / DSM 43827 / JCM 3225 / NBRC 14064 / NCIMB 13271 / NRRL B-12336 / IMRU 3971 / 101) TaxID=446462 RepID=C6WJ16_ACTMD|nr:diacylglycerol kinase catalytic region [Actinosynnema mirum DSM 43827]